MFQNVLMTGFTMPLCNTDEINCWDNRPFATVWPEKQFRPNKATEITRTIRKKPKRARTAFTTEQLRTLEKTFARSKYIDAEERKQLSACLAIGEKCIKIWFQNRRMKEKRDSESSCDSSTEVFSYADSPPTDIQQNPDVKDAKVETTNCMYVAQSNNYNPETHYQMPYGQYDNYTQYYYGVPSTTSSNASFCYDTNVYPTQYYPSAEYYTEQYSEQNGMSSNEADVINYF